MKISNLHHIASSDRMLSTLSLAIEEAKMARSLLRSNAFESDQQFADKLQRLEREIANLETKLAAMRSGSAN